MRPRASIWLIALSAVGATAVLLGCLTVFPRLLHPALSSVELRGITPAGRRVELQLTQAKLQNDVRAVLLQSLAGLVLVLGAIATWQQVRVSREGQITERFTPPRSRPAGDTSR